MRLTFDSTGDFRETVGWLKRVTTKSPQSTMNNMGRQIVSGLQASTPKDSGLLASSWKHKVSKTGYGWELVVSNDAYKERGINLALMLYYGHGTGTGGYVPPRDFINPVLRPIFASAGDKLIRELMK